LKTVILLREFEGMSYAEIARVIRRPIGTVMSRLFHARQRLQQSLRMS
jgi:RNA polymerase sigma-70 factor (ECF subfamily)